MATQRRPVASRRWLIAGLASLVLGLCCVAAAYAAAFTTVGLGLFVAGFGIIAVSVAAFLWPWMGGGWRTALATLLVMVSLLLAAPLLQRAIGSLFAE
jgi:hypothetical protein